MNGTQMTALSGVLADRRRTAQTLLEETPKELFINGRFTDSQAGARIPVINPATGQTIAEVAEARSEDIDAAVNAATRAFTEGEWSRMTPSRRGTLLWRLADLLEQHADDFALLETLDNGKPLFLARGDVDASVEVFRYYAGWAGKIDGRSVQPVSLRGWQAFTVRQPVGVVGQIIPWNFPLNMASWKLAPALAAGNTVVLKPSELTPLTALRLGTLIQRAGFPAGVVNIVPGYGRSAGEALAHDRRVAKIAFTGSVATGQAVARAAVESLKRVTLELGGKSPSIVLPDADPEQAIDGICHAIFTNQGEVCTAGSRAYVHRDIFEEVAAGVEQRAQSLQVGDGMDPETQMGPLISASHRGRVHGFVERGRDGGARISTGGKIPEGEGYYYPPTVVRGASHLSEMVQQEIFGPVLLLNPFESERQLIGLANGTDFGLAAGIWGNDVSAILRLADQLHAGTVWVNGYHAVDPALPFGGWKSSGWGRELGPDALDHYTETKSVYVAAK